MKKIQTQGVHHITMIGADRQTSIDFWEGVLGMPFVFEQPNLDVPEESHLYFDPGDGRLITVFTNEERTPDPARNPEGIGNLHHIAFTVSRATYTQIAKRLDARGISHTGEVDRGFMDSIYFRDPLGQLIECACYKFEPPVGATYVDVLREAHRIRVAGGHDHISDEHLADAIALLVERQQPTLSPERSAKDPYTEKPPVWD
jgi:catechol 2,3-dioxygenase-like lactoylglutathione lyase family enzyme